MLVWYVHWDGKRSETTNSLRSETNGNNDKKYKS